MPDQNILFNLEGDASNAIDALKSLLEALTGVNDALTTLATGVTALNDLVNAIGNLATSSINVTDLTDALAQLPVEEVAAADGAKVLVDSLAQLPAATDAVVSSVSSVASEVIKLDESLATTPGILDAIIPSLDGLATGFQTLTDTGVSTEAALSILETNLRDMLGMSAFDAADMIGQLADKLGLYEPVATSAATATDTLAQAEVASLDILSSYVVAIGDATSLTTSFSDIIALTADQLSIYVEALGRGVPEADAFAQAMGTLQVSMGDLSTTSAGSITAFDQIDQAFASLSAALAGATPDIQAVLDALTTMSASGMDAVTFFDLLDQACADAGVALSDVLTPLDALMTSLGIIAPAVADFSTSFTDAQLQMGMFGQSLSSIPAEVDAAAAAFGTMTAAEREAALASQEKNTALREQTAATQGDGFMALMLVQYMLQLATSFINMGTSAQDAIAHLSGLADQSLAGAAGASKLSGVIQQLEQDSVKFGINLTEASKGLYFIMSAGFNTSDSLLILKSVMEASSATGATMTSMGSGLTSILNAYGLSAKSASVITNEMVQSIVSGKMPAQDYSNAIGNLAAVAHQTGFTFVEATSSLSEFTQINGRTRQDAQNLAATFVVLGTRADDIAKAAKGLNISFNETAFKSMDLTQKLQYLSQIAGGDDTDAFRKLLLNSTAARTAFELLANGGKNLATVMGQVNNSQQALNIAFAESEKTVTASVNHMQAALTVLAYQLTVLATPVVQAALGALTSALNFLTQHMEILIPVVTALAVLFGGLLIGALIGVAGMLSGLFVTVFAIVGPIALVAAGVAFLVMSFQHLASVGGPLNGIFSVTSGYFTVLAGAIGGALNNALKALGPLLANLGVFIQVGVNPSLVAMGANLLSLVNGSLYSAITGFDGFVASLRPIGAFIIGSVVPAIKSFLVSASALGYGLSVNLVNAAVALYPTFSRIGGLLNVLGGAFQQLMPPVLTIASYLGGIFLQAIGNVGRSLIQLGSWMIVNVVPPLIIITTNIVKFAGVVLQQVVPALQSLLTPMQTVGAFITGSVVPSIGTLVANLLKVSVVISANIVPILQTLQNILIVAGATVIGFAATWAYLQLQVLSMFLPALVAIVTEILAGLIPSLVAATIAAWAAVVAFVALNWPLLLIIAAIALAVIGFIALWNASAPVRAVFAAVGMEALKLWNVLVAALGPVLQQLWATIQTQLVPAWNQLVAALQPVMPALMFLGVILGGVIVTVLGIVISLIAGLIAGLARFLMGIIQVVGGIVQVISGIVSVISGFLQIIVGVFTGNEQTIHDGWARMGQGIQTLWSGLGNILVGLIMATFGTIISFVVTFAQTFIQFFVNIWHALVGGSIWPDMLNAMLALLVGWVVNILSAVAAFVGQIIAAFVQFASQVLTTFTVLWAAVQVVFQTVLAALSALLSGNFARFVQLIVQAGAQMLSAMQNAWNGIANAVRQGVANVISAVTGLVSRLGSIFANLAASAFHWGMDFMSQMGQGIANAAGGVIQAAQNVASKVAGLLHFSVPDEGPLADADKWMPDFGDLLASGLNEQVNKVGKAASNMAMSVQMATPSSNDIARYSAPVAPSATPDESVSVLKLILAELQAQRQSGGGRMAIGHTLPSTALGTVSQTFGSGGTGINEAHQQYQQMNVLAGIAYENSVRGAITGLGV